MPGSFSDGMSNTILIAEKLDRCGSGGNQWARPTPDLFCPVFAAWSFDVFQHRPTPGTCDPRRASTDNDGGLLVGLADGSSRSIAPGISPTTWWAACTPRGGEVPGSDW